MRPRRTRLTSACILSATLIAIGGCAGGTECSWAKSISTSKQDVLTRQTENEIIAHNMKVARFCR